MSIHTEDVNKGLNGKISGAIVVWSSQHGLLLERAGIQSAWDDLACQDFLNALHSVSEPWKICCFHEAHESHTVTWTEAFLPKCQPNVCNLLSLNEFGMVFELMESYLLGRSQIVQISNAKPDILHMNCGVPQGSVLGPLLFLVYVNDVSKNIIFYFLLC